MGRASIPLSVSQRLWRVLWCVCVCVCVCVCQRKTKDRADGVREKSAHCPRRDLNLYLWDMRPPCFRLHHEDLGRLASVETNTLDTHPSAPLCVWERESVCMFVHVFGCPCCYTVNIFALSAFPIKCTSTNLLPLTFFFFSFFPQSLPHNGTDWWWPLREEQSEQLTRGEIKLKMRFSLAEVRTTLKKWERTTELQTSKVEEEKKRSFGTFPVNLCQCTCCSLFVVWLITPTQTVSTYACSHFDKSMVIKCFVDPVHKHLLFSCFSASVPSWGNEWRGTDSSDSKSAALSRSRAGGDGGKMKLFLPFCVVFG